MLRAVIIDDEIYVCDLIRHLVDWDKLGISLAGVAHTGVDALELLDSQRPEIVITDIRMPGYDGLTLMQKARELGLEAKFIVVSGYKQFEYAQKGLQLGAADYLLKPVNKAELETALQKVVGQHRQDENVEELNRELVSNKQLLRQQLVRDITEGRLEGRRLSPEQLQGNYSLELTGAVYAVCCHLDLLEQGAGDELLEYGLSRLRQHWDGEMERSCTDGLAFPQEGRLLILCALPEGNSLNAAKWGEAAARSLQSLHGIRLTLGVSALTGQGCVPTLLREARIAADYRLFRPGEAVLWFQPAMAAEREFREILPAGLAESLTDAIRSFSVEGIGKTLGRCFAHFRVSPAMNGQVLEGFLHWAAGEVNSAIGTLEEESRRYLNRTALLESLGHCPQLSAVESRFTGAVTGLMEEILEEIRKGQNRPVRLAKQLIEERYMDQISLADIADQVRLNPVYLSALFKKETGENFKDYLTAYRIERAKEMLRDSDDSIVEVAEQVGYKDTKYFSKLFAKQVGINPTQYRKLHF